MDNSRFNTDELAAQAIAGGGPRGGGAIRDFMPEQHREFFEQLPCLFVGAVDSTGWPLATLLTGPPGFVQSPDPNTLHIAALPETEDPAAPELAPGRDIGMLGIDFSTRRRNRANGRIVSRDPDGIRIAVSQSFGNCPQYIQLRTVAYPAPASDSALIVPLTPIESFDHLDAAAQRLIESADTLFVASRSRAGMGSCYGADISHRGGRPGFVRVNGDVLTIPDFRGNRYFNTLSNMTVEPRASLLIVDFENGDLLQLQGTAQVEWNGGAADQILGAERLWRFHVARGWRRRAASPLRWSFVEYSRTTAATGVWRERPSDRLSSDNHLRSSTDSAPSTCRARHGPVPASRRGCCSTEPKRCD
jgi:predicted pyridoxine 5'-phosphate oxidase superfamily flavin-nucleotide-binding protein